MNRLIRTLKMYDLAALFSIWGLVLAIVGTTLVQQQARAESVTGEQPAIDMAASTDDVSDLGTVIATQGNAALRQIREEQHRAALAGMRPSLPPPSGVAPELYASAEPPAGRSSTTVR